MDSETKSERSMKRGGRAYRSRLEPFVDFIREQRQQRRTWQEIAARLRIDHDCTITFQGLHQFYRRHLKRQTRGHWERSPAVQQIIISLANSQPRKAVLATTPVARSYRQPNPENINLNDPAKL